MGRPARARAHPAGAPHHRPEVPVYPRRCRRVSSPDEVGTASSVRSTRRSVGATIERDAPPTASTLPRRGHRTVLSGLVRRHRPGGAVPCSWKHPIRSSRSLRADGLATLPFSLRGRDGRGSRKEAREGPCRARSQVALVTGGAGHRRRSPIGWRAAAHTSCAGDVVDPAETVCRDHGRRGGSPRACCRTSATARGGRRHQRRPEGTAGSNPGQQRRHHPRRAADPAQARRTGGRCSASTSTAAFNLTSRRQDHDQAALRTDRQHCLGGGLHGNAGQAN